MVETLSHAGIEDMDSELRIHEVVLTEEQRRDLDDNNVFDWAMIEQTRRADGDVLDSSAEGAIVRCFNKGNTAIVPSSDVSTWLRRLYLTDEDCSSILQGRYEPVAQAYDMPNKAFSIPIDRIKFLVTPNEQA